ncbi:bifunctional lysylphosphatidylglycerol flippase/synthetase MprF [Donghicola mangrovi]
MSRSYLLMLRRAFPILLGAVLFAAGLYALLHLLRPVDTGMILHQIRTTPASALWGAAAGTVLGYVALAFYDWYALRYIGKSLSGGIIALGGFLGYAFGNTIGVSVVSGGAVRYRIYSAYGLNAFEVAAISGYIGLALGSGLVLVGLAAMAIHPHAVLAYLPYGPETVRWVAAAIFVGSVALITWMSVGDRRLSLMGYQLRMPPPGDLAGQVVVVLLDIAGASFALWVLLPMGKPDFATFVAIYSTAMMVGVLSHVPGGVGVFETVVIGTLPATVPVGDAAAALLLFRLIYYLIPFGIGFLIVALNEAREAGGFLGRLLARLPQPVQPALSTLHGLVPSLAALVAFGYGVYLLMVTMIPSVRVDAMAEGDLLSTLLREGGTLASAMAGVILLIISHGLARRVSAAFWMAVATLLAGAFAALVSDFNLHGAMLLGLGALSLLPLHKSFDRHGPLTQGVFELRWFLMVLAVMVATAAFFFFANRTVPYSNDLWVEFSPASDTPRALRAGLAASALLLLFCLFLATRPSPRRGPAVDEANPLSRAAQIIEASGNPQGWLAVTGDKQILFADEGDAFIMYAVLGGRWIAYGDPVGNPDRFAALCWRFSERAARANARPVFYEVRAAHLSMWTDLGFALNKVGEEAVIPLDRASDTLAAMQAAKQQRERDGYTFDLLTPPHSDAVFQELRGVSDAWLAGKTGQEKKFLVGPFALEYLDGFDIAVVRHGGRIVAFCNVMSSGAGRFKAIDLMRYLPQEGAAIMEFMFLNMIEHFRIEGAAEFSLGVAPLSGLSERTIARTWNRFGRMIYRHGGAFSDFEGLRAFKQAFQPEWRPRYVALPTNVSPLVAMSDVALLISGRKHRLQRRKSAPKP